MRGVDGADVTPWLRKVQFKLHETYAPAVRSYEAPEAFEVTETGWGEFEVGLRLGFAPESAEKPGSVYHQLRLHPWGADRESAKARGAPVASQCYDEVCFNEPNEAFYELLTGGPPPGRGKGGKGGKGARGKAAAAAAAAAAESTAEIPAHESRDNPYSVRTEEKELDRLGAAVKQVEALVKEEAERLAEREKELEELRRTEASVFKPK